MTATTLACSHGYVEGIGRLRLHYRTWEVPDPRAAILVVHGLAEHSGRYERLADTVANDSISTFAVDLRGHGSSEGRRGHCQRFACFLQDLARFRREVQGLVRVDCPLFLLGHSLGGLIVGRYLEEYETPFRGAVLSSPWLDTRMPVPPWKARIAEGLGSVLPALPVPAGVRPEDLSHDPDVVAAYRDDPVVHGTITPRLFREVNAAAHRIVERRDRLSTPLLVLLAGDDRLVDTDRAVDFARSIDTAPVTLRTYPGYFHEVLNEADADPVYTDLRTWLSARLA